MLVVRRGCRGRICATEDTKNNIFSRKVAKKAKCIIQYEIFLVILV